MNGDITELVRESIDRLTSGAAIPAGLAGRARERHHRRRVATGAVAVAGTAAVAVAAVLVATVGAQHGSPGLLRVRTAAYVTGRAERALLAAGQAHLIQQIRATGHHLTFGLPSRHGSRLMNDAQRMTIWLYRGRLRQHAMTAAGLPVFDASSRSRMSASGYRIIDGYGIDHGARIWWHAHLREYKGTAKEPPLTCKNVFVPPPVGAGGSWAAEIREALSCGLYHLDGRQRVDGTDAIKLISSMPVPGTNAMTRQTVWIDPSTYLPVRVKWARTRSGGVSLTGDFRWLEPTRANLAALRVTVPAGYRQVPSGGLPEPAFSFCTNCG